jgi:hypothetical protein
MQPIFECEIMSRSSRNAQIIIALPIGLIGGYLLINMLHAAFDKRLFMGEFLGFGIFIFIAGIIAEILIWYRTKGTLLISKTSDNELQIEIDFPSGMAELAKGSWTCEGIYTKEYEKFGMYKKHLALHLSCNQQPFCLLRHDLAPITAEPQHFMLVNELYNRGGTEYWCKKAEEVYALIQKENSFKN